MTEASSYKKVFYDLRPGKQIERRMLLDTFQLLSNCFRISDYQYTGFGSIYYVDFVLFHKYLGIRKLLSLEHDQRAEKRARFNKPYEIISLEIKSAFDAIPSLDRDAKHILWLDYDFTLESSVLADVEKAAFQLSPGSILLATVDVEPPELEEMEDSDDEPPHKTSPEISMQILKEECGALWDPTWTPADFVASKLANRSRDILNLAVMNSLAVRPGVSFLPLFSFVYRDGHSMYTFGGMVAGDSERTTLEGCALARAPYLRRNVADAPYEIKVPRLTRKERIYLDSLMPLKPGRTRNQIGFSARELRSYEEIYRFFPTYVEALL